MPSLVCWTHITLLSIGSVSSKFWLSINTFDRLKQTDSLFSGEQNSTIEIYLNGPSARFTIALYFSAKPGLEPGTL